MGEANANEPVQVMNHKADASEEGKERTMGKAKRKQKQIQKQLQKRKQQGDPEGYHAWLIGKGFSAANAMRMVDAKFGQVKKEREPDVRGFWKP